MNFFQIDCSERANKTHNLRKIIIVVLSAFPRSQSFDIHLTPANEAPVASLPSLFLSKMADERDISSVRFSNTEQDVIERQLGISSTKIKSKEELVEFYEIHRCVEAIRRCGFTQVRLF